MVTNLGAGRRFLDCTPYSYRCMFHYNKKPDISFCKDFHIIWSHCATILIEVKSKFCLAIFSNDRFSILGFTEVGGSVGRGWGCHLIDYNTLHFCFIIFELFVNCATVKSAQTITPAFTHMTATRRRPSTLFPPKPIPIKLFLCKTTNCLTRPATTFLYPKWKKNLLKTTTTNIYLAKKWKTVHIKSMSPWLHLFFCNFVMVYQARFTALAPLGPRR